MKNRRFLRILALLLTVGMLFGYTSCAVAVSAAELTGGLSRNEGSAPTAAQIEAGEGALAGFGFALWQAAMAEDDKGGNAPANRVFSPFSALVCLAMLAEGADGNTLAQMETAFGCSVEDLRVYLRWQGDRLASDDDCKIASANSVWLRDEDKESILPAYLQALTDGYAAQAYAAPFDDGTVRDINNWCAEHTDGMIDEILREINADTVLFLINALSFDAKWGTAYEKSQVYDGIFTCRDGAEKTVTFLRSSENTYLSGEDFTGFAKPYAGGKYAFVGLLPETGVTDADAFAAALTGERWRTVWQKRQAASVNVTFPEFKAETQLPLVEALKALGITDAFDGSADFSRMAEISLYCSDVQQKSVVEVDRNGTKAAAVTWGEMTKECAPMDEKNVALDRPFVWAIVDTESGMPLFCGTVNRLG